VVSSENRGEFTKKLGAVGYINRKDFSHWGRMPDWTDDKAYGEWSKGCRDFGKAFWDVLGERKSPRIVFEHPGQDTIPTSNFVCDRGGMIVICAGTTGYDTLIDVRYLWYLQKRYQGSHLFNDEQAASFNDLVRDGRIGTVLGRAYPYVETGDVHQSMAEGTLPDGNVAILVNAPEPGLTGLP
jgi:crotonyl-CoA carboxylase/reductase